MRYDGHPGDGDSAVESRPHPLVGYSGSQRVFFIFRPLRKDIGHESRSSSGWVSKRYHPTLWSVTMILHASEPRLQHANWISI